jgi:coenzyme F420-reducing hydrogenase alpha subunit
MENNRENRGRGKNFTNEEVLLLAELVAKNRSVIDNKQSGAITHKQKESAWQKLTDQFNAVTSGDRRTTKMLMEKWRNTKKNSTKNYSATKKSLYKTGGGSKESIIGMETPVDAVVHDIIGARITGYESVWDSDNVVSSMFGI